MTKYKNRADNERLMEINQRKELQIQEKLAEMHGEIYDEKKIEEDKIYFETVIYPEILKDLEKFKKDYPDFKQPEKKVKRTN